MLANKEIERYPFLDLLRESEAMARGANLADKVNHAVFKEVRNRSTVDVARQNKLFDIKSPVPDLINLTEKDLTGVLNKLIGDRVVAQIFRLEYEPGHDTPNLIAAYIAQPANEKETVFQLYAEMIRSSARALESLLDVMPQVNERAIRRDLEADIKSERSPEPGALPASVVELFDVVHASKFPVIPTPEVIKFGVEDIRAELIRRGRVLYILNYGLMPLRDSDVRLRFDTASAFLADRVVPMYRSRGTLRRELSNIFVDEETHDLDPFAPPTVEFVARRAQAVKEQVLAQSGRSSGARFPGSLTIEMVLALRDRTQTRLEEAFQQESLAAYRELKNKLLNPGENWRNLVLFISDEERAKMAPDVYRHLVDDEELLVGSWEKRDGTVTIFVRRDGSVFRTLVRRMLEVSPGQEWQVLALRSVLEENEDDFRALFEDPEFVVSYGRMLRNVYINFMPWYFRLLLQFGINFFQDQSFAVAKQRIQGDQNRQAATNKANRERKSAERERETEEKKLRLQGVAVSNRIIERLEALYFEQKRIPSVGEVQALLPDVDPRFFADTLRREGFQTAGGKDDDPASPILVFPMNADWRARVSRLRKLLEQPAVDPQQDERMKHLRKVLARPAGRATKGDEGAEAEDPDEAYERFGRALDEQKEKESKGASVDDESA